MLFGAHVEKEIHSYVRGATIWSVDAAGRDVQHSGAKAQKHTHKLSYLIM